MHADCDSGWMLRIVERYRRLDSQGHSASVHDEHSRLRQACESRQANLVANIMAEHLVNIRDRIRTALPNCE
jgi:DNA-binding GntR family transcriptional regulator